MYELAFNVLDMLKAPRAAFSIRKMTVNFRALVLGLIIYDVFSYGALLISGMDFGSAFSRYFLFPPILAFGGDVVYGITTISLSVPGKVIQITGILIFVLIMYLASAVVSKITMEQLRGNDFYSPIEAIRFVRRNLLPLLFTPTALFVLSGSVLLSLVVFGAIGRIPIIGDIFIALGIAPFFLISLSLIYFTFVWVFSLVLVPSIVGATGGDTFETIFETFSSVSTNPLRMMIYQVFHTLFGFVCWAFFGIITMIALGITMNVLTIVIGPKMLAIFTLAWQTIPEPVAFLFTSNFLGGIFSWIKPGYIELAGNPGVFDAVIATVFAFGLYAIIGLVLSYGLSIHSAGQTIIYVVMRKNKDEENLIDSYDAEYEEALMRETARAKAEIKRMQKSVDESGDGVEIG